MWKYSIKTSNSSVDQKKTGQGPFHEAYSNIKDLQWFMSTKRQGGKKIEKEKKEKALQSG